MRCSLVCCWKRKRGNDVKISPRTEGTSIRMGEVDEKSRFVHANSTRRSSVLICMKCAYAQNTVVRTNGSRRTRIFCRSPATLLGRLKTRSFCVFNCLLHAAKCLGIADWLYNVPFNILQAIPKYWHVAVSLVAAPSDALFWSYNSTVARWLLYWQVM